MPVAIHITKGREKAVQIESTESLTIREDQIIAGIVSTSDVMIQGQARLGCA